MPDWVNNTRSCLSYGDFRIEPIEPRPPRALSDDYILTVAREINESEQTDSPRNAFISRCTEDGWEISPSDLDYFNRVFSTLRMRDIIARSPYTSSIDQENYSQPIRRPDLPSPQTQQKLSIKLSELPSFVAAEIISMITPLSIMTCNDDIHNTSNNIIDWLISKTEINAKGDKKIHREQLPNFSPNDIMPFIDDNGSSLVKYGKISIKGKPIELSLSLIKDKTNNTKWLIIGTISGSYISNIYIMKTKGRDESFCVVGVLTESQLTKIKENGDDV